MRDLITANLKVFGTYPNDNDELIIAKRGSVTSGSTSFSSFYVIGSNGAFLLHGTARFGTARYGTAQFGYGNMNALSTKKRDVLKYMSIKNVSVSHLGCTLYTLPNT